MALRAMLARQRIDRLRKQLEPLQEECKKLDAREAELRTAVGEIDGETEERDLDETTAMVDEFEKNRSANDNAISKINDEIARLEEEIREDEKRTSRVLEDASKDFREKETKAGGEGLIMSSRTGAKRYADLPLETRDALARNSATHDLAEDFRALIKGDASKVVNRATGSSLSNVAFTIPTVYANTLVELTYGNSALLPLVDSRRVAGTEKQNIRIGRNEAVWMEQCQDIGTYVNKEWKQITLDVHQVAALADVCGAVAEDSDENLVAILMDELASAVAFAIDKAIIYGRGVGMPLGIATTLAYSAAPNNWPATGLAWNDLHTSHIQKLNVHGKDLFTSLTKLKRKINKQFGQSELTWVMNENTRDDLMLELAGFDQSYALVSSLGDSMPLAGGKIQVVDESLIPDGDIIVGRWGLYRYAPRGGAPIIDISDQVKWYSGTKVIKHVDRADGRPLVADAFMLINIANTAPTTTASFAGDTQQGG